MNLALGVLIIFILCFPGIVFRTTYLRSRYSKRTINTTTVEEIFSSLIPALIIHFLFILSFRIFTIDIEFQLLYNLLIGNNTAKDIDRLNLEIVPFFSYILLTSLIGYFSAWWFRRIVLRKKLYNKWPSLGIYNKWYYILRPEQLHNERISVWLDLLVKSKDGLIIYRGFLRDFWLDREGGIKELHLEDVRRRLLAKDSDAFTQNFNISTNEEEQLIEEVDKRYYYIPGELFILKYEDVKNINITYFEEI